MAAAVVRLKGYDSRLANFDTINDMFTDAKTIPPEIQPYIALAVENGIISGYDDGTFRGKSTITRAEAAAILCRAFPNGNEVAPPAEKPKTPSKMTSFSGETLLRCSAIGSFIYTELDDGDNFYFYGDNFYFYGGDSNSYDIFIDYYIDRGHGIYSLNLHKQELTCLLDIDKATYVDESGNTHENFKVKQLFYDNTNSQLLVDGTFLTTRSSDGWVIPGGEYSAIFQLENGVLRKKFEKPTERISPVPRWERVFSHGGQDLSVWELAYLDEWDPNLEVWWHPYDREVYYESIHLALGNGMYICSYSGEYFITDFMGHEYFLGTFNTSNLKFASWDGNLYVMVWQSGSEINSYRAGYSLYRYVPKNGSWMLDVEKSHYSPERKFGFDEDHNFATNGMWEAVVEGTSYSSEMTFINFKDGYFYGTNQDEPAEIEIIRPSDGLRQTIFNFESDDRIIDGDTTRGIPYKGPIQYVTPLKDDRYLIKTLFGGFMLLCPNS